MPYFMSLSLQFFHPLYGFIRNCRGLRFLAPTGCLLFFQLFLTAISRAYADEENPTHYSAIIKIDKETAVDSLAKAGVNILRRRENLLLCYIPIPQDSTHLPKQKSTRRKAVDRLIGKRIKGISKIERSRWNIVSMDEAKRWNGANRILKGEGLPSPYSGKGVVTGICDIGLDPLHVNFIDNQGNPRVKRVVQYKESTGERIVLKGKADYESWRTDNADKWHGTHVAGIMAGSYSANGYNGMAPSSDIVLTASELTDVGILCGAEDIIDYAKETGRPAVINMSLANYNGPHDGSSLFSQYLDMIGKEAIVVLSAGNAGDTTNTLPFDYTESAPNCGLPLYSTDWVQFDMHGLVDVWSRDSSPIKARFGIYDEIARAVIHYFDWQQLSGDNEWIISSDSVSADYNDTFAKYFSGFVSLKGGIDSENGRYRVMMEYDTHTDELSVGPWARYILTIDTEAPPGTHADFYADGQFTKFSKLPDGPMPGSLLSFSDLSSGFNLVSVGMFNNRNREPSLAGEDRVFSSVPGEVDPNSGYATLIDGRVMPLTVGPGNNVVSSCSGPYLEKHETSPSVLNAVANIDGKGYFWINCGGTSMSSPFVAGAIACWLEANPGLGIDDVKRIIESTNTHDYPDPENPRHGRGWFNAYEGLKEVLKMTSGIDSYERSERRILIGNGTATVFNPGCDKAKISIYNIGGIMVKEIISAEPIIEIPFDGLASGIYLISVDRNLTRKIRI